MAGVETAYSWASDGADLKAYLMVTGASEDARLQRWYELAIELTGDLLGNDFTDSDGNDIAHPTRVKTALFECVRAIRTQDKEPPVMVGRASLRESLGDINHYPWLGGP